jgi:K+-sensing histidine kinase KdpD
VLGDRVQLQQVLLKLVVNGMHAMSSVAERERLLEIHGSQDSQDGGPMVRIRVRDRGIGLDSGQPERLFDAFSRPSLPVRAWVSRSAARSSTRMGGRLWAEAESKQVPGATLSFCVPAAARPRG